MKANFSWERSAGQYAALYAQLIPDRRRKAPSALAKAAE
jgi:starch synthase